MWKLFILNIIRKHCYFHSVPKLLHVRKPIFYYTEFSTRQNVKKCDSITVLGNTYTRDDFTNVTPHILSFVSQKLYQMKNHPLNLIKLRIVRYFYGNYLNRRGNPLFSVYDKLSPVVSVHQNFDSLLVPQDHPSRSKRDSYYINSTYLLRPHTSAHQHELIKSGLDHFLVVGDVYRRDQIDATHFPVFHQCEGVRLFSEHELFSNIYHGAEIRIFESDSRLPYKQEKHTQEAAKLVEQELKSCLVGLMQALFGLKTEYRWSESYFPFTHPSWELEVRYEGEWLEVLGCGIIEQKILDKAGASTKIGWAFGIGLERIAMKLFGIPDIRLFWSKDSGFLTQFDVKDLDAPIKYKPISKYPQCSNDIAFWVPKDFHPNDFYDLVRSIGEDMIEQVYKIDEFFHPKHKKLSYCFRVIYRHMERTLTQEEVNDIHQKIEKAAVKCLKVEIR